MDSDGGSNNDNDDGDDDDRVCCSHRWVPKHFIPPFLKTHNTYL